MSTADVVTGNSVATSAVSLSGLRKVYGDVVAVAQVDLEVRTGEIHALLGENGAGKTTLMRLLYGLAKPDAGSISIDGTQMAITSPKVARAAGIGMVTQHFSLVKTMTVTENLVLQDAGFFSLDLAGARKKLLALCEEIGLEIDPDARIDSLPVAMQQRVEILKALAGGCKVLILDEPTAVLGPQDVDSLLDVIRRLRDTIGLSVILITHKMHEISKVADRVSVLRRGEIVATENANGMSIAALTSLMVEGVQQEVVEEGVRSSHGASVLSIKDLTVHLRGHDVISDLSLEVRRGEIVGIAGVSGNGQSELVQALSGVFAHQTGEISVDGKVVKGGSPAAFAQAGFGRLGEDRHASAVSALTVEENLILDRLHFFSKPGLLLKRKIRKFAEESITNFAIKAKPDQAIGTLSGGNMQKVLLARLFGERPLAAVVSQPTRGLDVVSTRYVRQLLMLERNAGVGILLVSEDLDEILELSDRVLVIFKGKIVGEVARNEIDRVAIGAMMAGV